MPFFIEDSYFARVRANEIRSDIRSALIPSKGAKLKPPFNLPQLQEELSTVQVWLETVPKDLSGDPLAQFWTTLEARQKTGLFLSHFKYRVQRYIGGDGEERKDMALSPEESRDFAAIEKIILACVEHYGFEHYGSLHRVEWAKRSLAGWIVDIASNSYPRV